VPDEEYLSLFTIKPSTILEKMPVRDGMVVVRGIIHPDGPNKAPRLHVMEKGRGPFLVSDLSIVSEKPPRWGNGWRIYIPLPDELPALQKRYGEMLARLPSVTEPATEAFLIAKRAFAEIDTLTTEIREERSTIDMEERSIIRDEHALQGAGIAERRRKELAQRQEALAEKIKELKRKEQEYGRLRSPAIAAHKRVAEALRDLGVMRVQIMCIDPGATPPTHDTALTAWVPATFDAIGLGPRVRSEEVYPGGEVKEISSVRYASILAARDVLYSEFDR
jgi:hypothetical protein